MKFLGNFFPLEESGLSRKIIQNYRKRNRTAAAGEEKGTKKERETVSSIRQDTYLC